MRLVGSNGAAKVVLLLAGAVAAGLAALTPAKAGDAGVPFTARLSGAAAYTSPTTVRFSGQGVATHMGRVADSGVAVFGAPGGSCPGGVPGFPNDHTETLTAANGDTLVIRMTNVACPTGPSSFHGTGPWTVVGGTGRFEGATGSGWCDGRSDFQTNTFEAVLTGTLTYR
jgi:hypothetical protein